MGLAEHALEKLPSARGALITQCTYRRASYVPARDRAKPLLEQFALSIAAYLLKVDDNRSPAEIASELSCTESKAKLLATNGEQVVQASADALELVAKIRDDVYEGLERVGMRMMLTEEPSPEQTLMEPIPETVPKMIWHVSKSLGVDVPRIKGPSRRAPETDARHIAMRLVQHIKPQLSYRQIGNFFGNRDHSTVLSALRRVDRMVRGMEDDPLFLDKIDRVRVPIGLEREMFHFVERRE